MPELNKRAPHDAEAAKKLLAEAGYPNGFEVGMNCPNDRYVNDGEICQAIAANLGAHRREDQPAGRIQGHLLPEDPSRNTSFYMLGWTPTYDAHNALSNLMATA